MMVRSCIVVGLLLTACGASNGDDTSDSQPSNGDPTDADTTDATDDPTETTEAGETTTETGDPESCEVPAEIVGCEGVEVPETDVPEFARGIIVNDDGAVLTFADVNAPDLLCGESGLLECSCSEWTESSRFIIGGALAVGAIDPTLVSLSSAGGDCSEGGSEFDEVVLELEITAITDTCVAGRVAIEDGLGALPTAFGFVAPRC